MNREGIITLADLQPADVEVAATLTPQEAAAVEQAARALEAFKRTIRIIVENIPDPETKVHTEEALKTMIGTVATGSYNLGYSDGQKSRGEQ